MTVVLLVSPSTVIDRATRKRAGPDLIRKRVFFADENPCNRVMAEGTHGERVAVFDLAFDHGATGAAICAGDVAGEACFVFRFHANGIASDVPTKRTAAGELRKSLFQR